MTSASYWDLFVKLFAEAFQLDEGQRTMAYSVLAQMKTKAQAYRRDHEQELRQTQKSLDELQRHSITATKPIDKELLEALQHKVESINQPLLEMFDELYQKLLQIPTEQQLLKGAEILGEENLPSAKGEAVTRPSAGGS